MKIWPKENLIPAPGVLLRVDVLIGVCAWNERFQCEDSDLWLRIAGEWEVAQAGRLDEDPNPDRFAAHYPRWSDTAEDEIAKSR